MTEIDKVSFYDGLQLWCYCTLVSTNYGANSSTFSFSLGVYRPSGNTRYPYTAASHAKGIQYSTDWGNTWHTIFSGSSSYNFTSSSPSQNHVLTVVGGGNYTFSHDSYGNLDLMFRGYFNGETPLTATNNVTIYTPGYYSAQPQYIQRNPYAPTLHWERFPGDMGRIRVWADWNGARNNGPGPSNWYWQVVGPSDSYQEGYTNSSNSETNFYVGQSDNPDLYVNAISSGGWSDIAGPSTAWAPPRIDYIGNPNGIVGRPYSSGLSGTNVYSYSQDGLPPGLGVSGSSISGTPTTPGTYGFTIYASNNWGSVSAGSSITVRNSGPNVKISGGWQRTNIKVYNNGWQLGYIQIYNNGWQPLA
jgi:hypothetical protein